MTPPDSTPYRTHSSPSFRWMVVALLAIVTVRSLLLLEFTTHVDDILPLVEAVRRHTDVNNPWSVIQLSRNYTYAPGQFIFSLPLAFGLSHDWQGLLFWARFVSLCVWAAGILGGYAVLRQLTNRPAALVGAAILAFSLRGILESSQSYNYAGNLLISIGMVWFFCCDRGVELLEKSPWAGILLGIFLGCSVWITYQTVFLALPFFAAMGIQVLWRRRWRLLISVTIAGLIMCASFFAAWILAIRYTVSFAKTIPPWAEFTTPGVGLFAFAVYPFRAWWGTVQNVLTPLPWGLWSAAVTILLGAAAIYGYYRSTPVQTAQFTRLKLLGLCVLICFTALGYLKLFPLGPTRHTYALQFPIVALLVVGWDRLQLPSRWYRYAAAAIAAIGIVGASLHLPKARRQMDIELMKRLMIREPEAIITDLTHDVSWDFGLFAREIPGGLDRMRFWIFLPGERDQTWMRLFAEHKTVFVYSHRMAMQTGQENLIHSAAPCRITTLAAMPPTGGAELSGLINEGNAFYLYRVDRL